MKKSYYVNYILKSPNKSVIQSELDTICKGIKSPKYYLMQLKKTELTDLYHKVVEVDNIVNLLTTCTIKNEVEGVFEWFGISDPTDKSNFLLKTMQATRNESNDSEHTPEDDYQFDLAVFLEGTWREIL